MEHEESIIYKTERKQREIAYTGETKFNVTRRLDQHKKDVEYRGTNAIAKHVQETNHEINWERGRMFRTGRKEHILGKS